MRYPAGFQLSARWKGRLLSVPAMVSIRSIGCPLHVKGANCVRSLHRRNIHCWAVPPRRPQEPRGAMTWITSRSHSTWPSAATWTWPSRAASTTSCWCSLRWASRSLAGTSPKTPSLRRTGLATSSTTRPGSRALASSAPPKHQIMGSDRDKGWKFLWRFHSPSA